MTAMAPVQSPVKLILVTGSVVSGVGKGIVSSSLGVLLKANGYRVSAIKIDPYINVDAGMFSPFEHGEVFVLDDGGEVDLDLGNYERFLNVRLTRDNNITTGKIFKQVIEQERRGVYLGETVKTIPHVTDAIIEWVERVAQIPVDGSNLPPHVCIVELGGTIGDIEGMPYAAAFSENYHSRGYRHRLMNVHVTMLLHVNCSGEIKTKPAQNGIRKVREAGLVPDLVMCRCENELTGPLREKIAAFAQVDNEQIIDVHDVSNIYKVPILLHQQNVLGLIQKHLNLEKIQPEIRIQRSPNIIHWSQLSNYCEKYTEEVRIALVGKYIKDGAVFSDAYASVVKALGHAAMFSERKLKIDFIYSEYLETPKERDGRAKHEQAWNTLRHCQGVIVPGGFGARGIEGMIAACNYARVNRIPFLGICLGMQCAAIEYARNVCGIENANSTEFNENLKLDEQVIIDMPEHDKSHGMGATMRLGKRTTVFLTEDSVLRKLYKNKPAVEERHRHRYEVNPLLVPKLSRAGLLFVGMGVDEKMDKDSTQTRSESSAVLFKMAEAIPSDSLNHLLKKIDDLCSHGGDGVKATAIRMEMVEIKDHPYYVGVQYHPEYLSAPLKQSPPFYGLVMAASNKLESFLSGSRVPSPAELLASEGCTQNSV